MTSAWVAGSVRSRALARRRLGSEAARRIAACGSLPEALEAVASTPYGREVGPGQTLAEAQRGIAATLLWHLRVLAGWLPRDGVATLRTLAGWFEIANTDELMYGLTGGAPAGAYQLGALATAWSRLRGANTLPQLRTALAASAWADPGGQEPRAIRLGMRVAWATQVATLPEPAPSWADAAAALLLAGERFVTGQPIPEPAAARLARLLGSAPVNAASLDELAQRLPAAARWVLTPAGTPGELWRAQSRWWAHVERDGFKLLASPGFTGEPVLGTVALLAADAWRLRAALELAARGGQPLDTYDAVTSEPVTYGAAAPAAVAADATPGPVTYDAQA